MWETCRVQRSRDFIRYSSELQRSDNLRESGGGRSKLREQPLQACVRCGHDLAADPRRRLGSQQSNATKNPKTGIRAKMRGVGMTNEGE
jgi:hypothetical protein